MGCPYIRSRLYYDMRQLRHHTNINRLVLDDDKWNMNNITFVCLSVCLSVCRMYVLYYCENIIVSDEMVPIENNFV